MATINRPETALQRLQALEAAKNKADVTAPASRAFSDATLARLLLFLPLFRLEVQQMGSALSAQSAATVLAEKAKAKLKKFISHFFQVFNLGVSREIYAAAERAFFNIDVNSENMPRLVTEQEIGTWGQRVVTGDAARVAAGGAPMSNPSAADVQAEHTAYTAAQGDQSTKKDTFDHEQEDVETISEEADDLIADIWDEVEFTFRKDSPPSKRRKAREYGVVYVPNKGEVPSPDDFSIMGKATDSVSGNGLNEVSITLIQNGVVVFTNSDGNYYVGVQPAGSYDILVQKAGYLDKTIPGVIVTAGVITTLNVTLATAAGTGTISGNVNAPGFPPATITVVGSGQTATTDPMGNFSITGVAAGTPTVQCFLDSDPANIKTATPTVVAGATVTVNFSFP